MKDNIENIQSIKDVKGIVTNLFPIFYRRKGHIGIFSMCFYRIEKNKKKNKYDKYLSLNDDLFKMNTLFKRGLGGIALG